MNSDEIILEQYKMYAEQKDKFTDRSFMTNKFYLVLVLTLILTMFLTKDFTFALGLSSNLVFSVIGMCICALWWINMDSYNFLIKIKFAKVLEQLETRLPVQPFKTESQGIAEYKKDKREFLFADIQKSLSVAILLIFLVVFINEIVSVIFA